MTPFGPMGMAPPIPGVTGTQGVSPSDAGPKDMLSMVLGMQPGLQMGATDKMAQVVQLLREIAKDDPRQGMFASQALEMLTSGPPPGGPGKPPGAMPPPMPSPQGMANGGPLMGGPGGAVG